MKLRWKKTMSIEIHKTKLGDHNENHTTTIDNLTAFTTSRGRTRSDKTHGTDRDFRQTELETISQKKSRTGRDTNKERKITTFCFRFSRSEKFQYLFIQVS